MPRSDYLAYGGHEAAEGLDLQGTLEYLQGLGLGGGYLEQAREAVAAYEPREFAFERNENYCDFCMARLMGGEFDRLADGRERCLRCSRTVLASQDAFQELFEEVRRGLEAVFDVSLTVSMPIRMSNAREIARQTGERFQPTPGFDGRVLGFVRRSSGGLEFWIENGAPKLAALGTIAHELTHVWQYRTWDEAAVRTRYGAEHALPVYEGMASWVMVQYLYSIKEFDYARREEAYLRLREDEYGAGFRIYESRYPLDRSGDIDTRRDSPFRRPLPL